LRSDREHCASRVAVEQEEEERRGGEEQATDIKSNNPHLAGGEYGKNGTCSVGPSQHCFRLCRSMATRALCLKTDLARGRLMCWWDPEAQHEVMAGNSGVSCTPHWRTFHRTGATSVTIDLTQDVICMPKQKLHPAWRKCHCSNMIFCDCFSYFSCIML
jgi:hypothetical protein